jgi:hypothetical protein
MGVLYDIVPKLRKNYIPIGTKGEEIPASGILSFCLFCLPIQ